MELISAFGGVGNVGTPGKSFRGYLVSRTEFLREEAHRVIEIVLRAEPNHEGMDLVRLLTRCAERAIQEKVNKDTWIREHDASEEPSDGNFSSRTDAEQEGDESADAVQETFQPSADEVELAATLQAAADAAQAAAECHRGIDSDTSKGLAQSKSRASSAAGQRLERASTKIANRQRGTSSTGSGLSKGGRRTETRANSSSTSLMRIDNKLDPNAAYMPREGGDKDEEPFEDTIAGCVGHERVAGASAWLASWQIRGKKQKHRPSHESSTSTKGAAWELPVSSDALAVDGNEFAAVGVSGDFRSISVCDAATGLVKLTLPSEHSERVCSVTMSGHIIVTGSRDKSIRFWRRSGPVTASFGCRTLDEVPLCLALNNGLLLSGESTRKKAAKARLWKVHSPGSDAEDDNVAEELCLYAEHSEPIWSVALSDDYALTASHDSTARVWPIRLLGPDEYIHAKTPSHSTLEHPASVDGVSVDGLLAATGCGDGKVRLWSLVSFTCLRILSHPAGDGHGAQSTPAASKPKASSSVFCVKLMGSVCISHGEREGELNVWSLAEDEDGEGNEQAGVLTLTLNHTLPNIRAVAVSPSGFIAGVGSSRTSRSLMVWLPS